MQGIDKARAAKRAEKDQRIRVSPAPFALTIGLNVSALFVLKKTRPQKINFGASHVYYFTNYGYDGVTGVVVRVAVTVPVVDTAPTLT